MTGASSRGLPGRHSRLGTRDSDSPLRYHPRMSTAEKPKAAAAGALAARFTAFAIEQFPEAFETLRSAFDGVLRPGAAAGSAEEIEALRPILADALRRALPSRAPRSTPETTPGVDASDRLAGAAARVIDACDGFLAREAIAASLTPGEQLEILRGMVLTRAIDNRLKAFFTGGEVRCGDAAFQGKGFRSLGQEAIYAAGDPAAARGAVARRRRRVARRRRRAADPRPRALALAMRPERETVRMVLIRADGEGRAADGRQGSARRRLRTGASCPASAPLAIAP